MVNEGTPPPLPPSPHVTPISLFVLFIFFSIYHRLSQERNPHSSTTNSRETGIVGHKSFEGFAAKPLCCMLEKPNENQLTQIFVYYANTHIWRVTMKMNLLRTHAHTHTRSWKRNRHLFHPPILDPPPLYRSSTSVG